MGSPDIPKLPATPPPIAQDVTDRTSGDLLSRSLRQRKGRRASFLTKEKQATERSKSLLGTDSQTL